MRRYGEEWRADAPYRDRPGIYAIILDGDEILLAATQKEALLLPGGGIDAGEQPMQALHREVLEETGFRIEPVRRLTSYQRYCFMPDYGIWARKVCAVHLCWAGLQIADPIEPDHTPVWVNASVAAEMLTLPAERAILQDFLNGRL